MIKSSKIKTRYKTQLICFVLLLFLSTFMPAIILANDENKNADSFTITGGLNKKTEITFDTERNLVGASDKYSSITVKVYLLTDSGCFSEAETKTDDNTKTDSYAKVDPNVKTESDTKMDPYAKAETETKRSLDDIKKSIEAVEPVTYTISVGASGLFNQNIDLALGDNIILVTQDKDGKTTEKIFIVRRKDAEIKNKLEKGIVLPGQNKVSP